MKITEQMLAAWNNNPTYIGGEYRQIAGRGRMWVVRGIATMTAYTIIGSQRWPIISGNVALCDAEARGQSLTPESLAATLSDKRVVLHP